MKYRIREVTEYVGTYWVIERKFWLFWINYKTGCYSDKNEAIARLNELMKVTNES